MDVLPSWVSANILKPKKQKSEKAPKKLTEADTQEGRTRSLHMPSAQEVRTRRLCKSPKNFEEPKVNINGQRSRPKAREQALNEKVADTQEGGTRSLYMPSWAEDSFGFCPRRQNKKAI